MENINKLKGTIPIVFACDDNYIPFLAVTLESLEENASRDYQYDIIVLHANGISSINKKEITNEYDNGIFHISFVDISSHVNKLGESLHTRDYYSKSTYFRLFIPNLYKQYDKVLYLDSDIVVKGDISELYNIDLGDNYVGATPDEFVQACPVLWSYVENTVATDDHEKYFNAGVLLMNTKKMREIDFEEKFLYLLGQIKYDVAQDQDYLNAICRNKVTYISPMWDKQPFKDDKITVDDIKIIHYNLDLKPWKKDGVEYADEFWYYAKTSGYYDVIRQIKESTSATAIEVAKNQTANIAIMCEKQGGDVVENARIRRILDTLFVDDETPLKKLMSYAENLNCNLFGSFDEEPQEQNG